MRPRVSGDFLYEDKNMNENRIALLAIVVEDTSVTSQMNELLHEYGNYIIGRMGVPYREKKIALISVAIDAPNEVINALCGKLGRLNGLNVKTVYAKV